MKLFGKALAVQRRRLRLTCNEPLSKTLWGDVRVVGDDEKELLKLSYSVEALEGNVIAKPGVIRFFSNERGTPKHMTLLLSHSKSKPFSVRKIELPHAVSSESLQDSATLKAYRLNFTQGPPEAKMEIVIHVEPQETIRVPILAP